jgi:mRNA interferase MazF
MKKQFDIWLVNLNPARGTVPGKIRPVVVVQTNFLNQLDHPSTLICPITSQLFAEATVLRVRLLGGKKTGLDQDSEILIDQLRAVDNLRFLERLGSIEKEEEQELKQKLGLVLDF